MSSRDFILDRVRKNQPAPQALPEVPTFVRPLDSPLAAFTAALARMGGVVAEPQPGQSLDALIGERFPNAVVICSATAEVQGTRPIATVA